MVNVYVDVCTLGRSPRFPSFLVHEYLLQFGFPSLTSGGLLHVRTTISPANFSDLSGSRLGFASGPSEVV